MPPEWLHQAWGNGSRRLLIAAGLFFTSVVILVGVVVWQLVAQPAKPNPLGVYPVQRVADDQPRFATGEAYTNVTGVVKINATKCNDTNHPVTIRGQSEWRRVEPPGHTIKVGRGTDIRQPGCETFRYENNVPPAVAADVAKRGPSTWQITGEETPIVDGREGETRAWYTENFLVVP